MLLSGSIVSLIFSLIVLVKFFHVVLDVTGRKKRARRHKLSIRVGGRDEYYTDSYVIKDRIITFTDYENITITATDFVIRNNLQIQMPSGRGARPGEATKETS
jgi:hypothetical protein